MNKCIECQVSISKSSKSGCCRSCSKIGSRNPQWKGDQVGLSKLHEWVKSRFPKPKFCDNCLIVPPIDLANKGIYNRELGNWGWLCRKCHMESDGRLKSFLSHKKSFQKGNRLYKLRVDLKGEDSPASKLTAKQVIEIREKYKTGDYTLEQLGKEYGVIFQTISLIILRKNWKHI